MTADGTEGIPNLRSAACCYHCHRYSTRSGQCTKYAVKVFLMETCDKFISKPEVEGRSS